MNFLNTATGALNYDISVYTTNSDNNFIYTNEKCRIIRIKSKKNNAVSRYLSYFKFNLITNIYLFFKKVDAVYYFETISCFPAFVYKHLNDNVKVLVHHHEYVSSKEKKYLSLYLKCLWKIEAKVFSSSSWISQTNIERRRLFLEDYPMINKSIVRILPNYPPSSWTLEKPSDNRETVTQYRIIYVGSISIKTMYLKEFAVWVNQQKGKVIWDIYSRKYTKDIIEFLHVLASPYINLNPPVNYFDLPKLLKKYHIGVVLYKGHIPNYIYNVPNKIFEYLFFGLEVWCPNQMLPVLQLIQENPGIRIRLLDFKKNIDIENTCLNHNTFYRKSNRTFLAENSFEEIIAFLNNSIIN